MEKRTLHTPDVTARNVARIAELFPNVMTESHDADGKVTTSIDFDLLRQELSDHIVDGPNERYQLDWPGKRSAVLAANASIAKTLRPMRDVSIDFDTTENLFIEGDNLEALKLLQESYLGKIKLIYIDPPYNTGNDFVYDDDFAETAAEYLARSVQVSESGERLVANPESNGRFHSDWLSMIYPRLKTARNLLHDDGLIFISIDSGEFSSLKLLCDEVFGANNFIDVLVWQKKVSPSNDSQFFSNDYEHILVYAKLKRPGVIDRLERTGEHNKYYTNPDDDPRGPWNSVAATSNKSSSERPNLYYPILNPNSGLEVWPVRNLSWKYSRETMQDLINDGRLYWGATGLSEIPRVKKFLSDAGKVVPRNVLHYHQYGSTQSAKSEFRDLMGEIPFDYPKPAKLIEGLLSLLPDDDKSPIVLDFFAGSGTTGQAVLQKNVQDGGSRRFILVQLSEPLNASARNLGYSTIADVARERIRRVGTRLVEASKGSGKSSQDVGFRAVKVESSSKVDLLRSAEATGQLDLVDLESSIKPGRTGEDLLFQVLLDWGLELTLRIVREEIDGREVFAVDDDALLSCFARTVTPAVIRALAERAPLRAVFRDDAFESDAARINAEQIFKEISPSTEVRTI